MKRVLAAVVFAGCASGTAAQQQDAPIGGGGPDAKVFLDGTIEGHPDAPFDARPDAPPDARPDAPPDACVPQTTELLQNPVFDLTPAGTLWTQTPIDPNYPPITSDLNQAGGFAAQTAPYKVWLGGFVSSGVGSVVTDIVYQDVTIPAGTTQLVLTGYMQVGTGETTTGVYDTASLDLQQTNGTPIENVESLTNNSGTNNSWVAISHNFTAIPVGQTVRLRMTSSNDYSNATAFLFDTFSLKATHCP
jgi:hypothetical protein